MVKIDDSDVQDLYDQLQDLSKHMLREGVTYFRDITPRDGGNARRKTRLSRNRIVADYPYAGRLDDGHSDQAPRCMTQPTIEFWEQQVDEFVRSL